MKKKNRFQVNLGTVIYIPCEVDIHIHYEREDKYMC